jgi:hypothetical protein
MQASPKSWNRSPLRSTVLLLPQAPAARRRRSSLIHALLLGFVVGTFAAVGWIVTEPVAGGAVAR